MRAIDVKQLEDLLNPAFGDMGFAIVLLRLTGGKERPTVQILVERNDGSGVTLDECAKLSREASALIDVENIIDAAYVLELSSPGIDRPLTKAADYQRFLGHDANIELREKMDGRRRFKGKLVKADGNAVTIEQEGAVFDLPMADILNAKLVLSDTLLKAKKPGGADATK